MKMKIDDLERDLIWAILPPGHPILNAMVGKTTAYQDVHPQFPIHVPFDNKLTLTAKGNLKGPRAAFEELHPFVEAATTSDRTGASLRGKFAAVLGELPLEKQLPLVKVHKR